MGRKRTSNKTRVGISIDKDIKTKLQEYGVNMSLLFTNAALKEIERLELEKSNTTINS